MPAIATIAFHFHPKPIEMEAKHCNSVIVPKLAWEVVFHWDASSGRLELVRKRPRESPS